MLKVKSIKKEGKNLTIIVKKPYFMSLQKFMKKNNLYFSKYDKEEEYNFNWCLTLNGDIKLEFMLRNSDDIKPYIEPTEEMKKIADEIVKRMNEAPVELHIDGKKIKKEITYYHTKKVQQYKDNKLIKEYNSLNEIQKKKGYNRSHISEVCNGKRPSAYGYVWKFKEISDEN